MLTPTVFRYVLYICLKIRDTCLWFRYVPYIRLKYETQSSFLQNYFKIEYVRYVSSVRVILDNDFFPMELSPHEHADLAVGVWQLLCARIIRYRTTAGRTTSRENKIQITIVRTGRRPYHVALSALSLSLSLER